jgi:acetyl esterase/lipase
MGIQALLVAALGALAACQVTPELADVGVRPVLELWPGPVPGESGLLVRPEVVADTGGDGVHRIRFVDRPTLTFYGADEPAANGCCVVVLPGGGYNLLAWNKEGTEVAEWLNTLGVSAVVVKYRVPRRDKGRPHVWPLQDAQRALRITRSRAAEWSIDPDRIGLLGFSAGGHLALAAGTADPGELVYPRVDAADDVSGRADFLIPIYAAYLGKPGGGLEFPEEIRLSRETPPTFMAVTFDDLDRGADAARLFVALKGLGVSSELHVFSEGGHGYGLRDTGHAVNGWPRLCGDWMKASGFLEPRSATSPR